MCVLCFRAYLLSLLIHIRFVMFRLKSSNYLCEISVPQAGQLTAVPYMEVGSTRHHAHDWFYHAGSPIFLVQRCQGKIVESGMRLAFFGLFEYKVLSPLL